MIRMFETHTLRPQKELSGLWDFAVTDEAGNESKARRSMVPGCWNTMPGLENYRGTAVYRRTICTGRDANLRLVFEGVSHTADVYLDGVKLVHHYNAYTPFEAVAPQCAAGEHLLEVRVDDRFGEASALHTENDYMTYGGITRPVALEEVPGGFIRWAHYTPKRGADGAWMLEAAVCVAGVGTASSPATVAVTFAGKTHILGTAQPAAGKETVVAGSVAAGAVTAWMPEAPALYSVTATLCNESGTAFDDLIDRVGFREVKLSGRQILLNDRPLRIKGFCRHEDHALFGCALPVETMQQDLELLRDLGANSVRTTHYPNDERFLDLCDEQGFLVWEENHARGFTEEPMRNPNFERQCEDCNREMVTAHYNHPCIYIWGILNECASDTEYGRTCYEAQLSQLRALDQSRPRTFATCRFQHKPDGSELRLTDICMDLPDVVSYNCYPLWYFNTDVDDFLARLHTLVEQTEGVGKPFLISEIGAGAEYGCRSEAACKWTEEYQAEALHKQLTAVLRDPLCSGVYIWQLADVPVTGEWFKVRPRSHNNKGVVDEYRRRKLACREVKSLFTAFGNYLDEKS